jgi:hypothetical protein
MSRCSPERQIKEFIYNVVVTLCEHAKSHNTDWFEVRVQVLEAISAVYKVKA